MVTPSLVPLYASFAALQVADGITTRRALRNPQLRELNPIAGRFVQNTAGMVVLKAATTAVTVVAVETLRKRNRVAAVATIMGINAAYMVIVSRNAAVVR